MVRHFVRSGYLHTSAAASAGSRRTIPTKLLVSVRVSAVTLFPCTLVNGGIKIAPHHLATVR